MEKLCISKKDCKLIFLQLEPLLIQYFFEITSNLTEHHFALSLRRMTNARLFHHSSQLVREQNTFHSLTHPFQLQPYLPHAAFLNIILLLSLAALRGRISKLFSTSFSLLLSIRSRRDEEMRHHSKISMKASRHAGTTSS
jgi:hypothetical protein